MKEIIEVLMNRDGLSYADAKEAYLECQEAIQEAINNNEIFEVDEILRSELGLEPDYIFNFI
jgi:predicted metallopeptidase